MTIITFIIDKKNYRYWLSNACPVGAGVREDRELLKINDEKCIV